jgi:hypothetical protein
MGRYMVGEVDDRRARGAGQDDAMKEADELVDGPVVSEKTDGEEGQPAWVYWDAR